METATQGLYTYRTRNYDGSFNQFHVLVEVIGETARSYRIRLLQPLYGPQHPQARAQHPQARLQQCLVERLATLFINP